MKNFTYAGKRINQKVLVTGANGFLGGREMYWLKWHGYKDVVGTDLREPKYQLPEGFSWRTGNITKDEDLEKILEDVDVVINNAAIFNFGADEDLMYRVNAMAPVGILRTLDHYLELTGKPKYMIQVSSGTVYAPVEDPEEMLTEDSPLGPIEAYGKSKLLSEQLLETEIRRLGSDVKLSIVRPAVIYGPMFPTGSSYGAAIAAFTQDLTARTFLGLTGAPMGGENTRACYVHVDDVCNLHDFIITKNLWGETFNAVSRTLITHKDLGRIVNDALDLPWYKNLLGGKVLQLPEKPTLAAAKTLDYVIDVLQDLNVKVPTLGMEGNVKYMFAPAFPMSSDKAVSYGFVHEHPDDHESMRKVLKEYIDNGWPTLLGNNLSKLLKRK